MITQGANSVAVGFSAGVTTQGTIAVAIGNASGTTNQGAGSVAVGFNSGNNTQGINCVALGNAAGTTTQGTNAVAIGIAAASTNQCAGSVAIGNTTGNSAQGANCVAIGSSAGRFTQGINAVAIGINAGLTSQGTISVAIGTSAGQTTQGTNCVAIGNSAGFTSQPSSSTALGAYSTPTASNEINLRAGTQAVKYTAASGIQSITYPTATSTVPTVIATKITGGLTVSGATSFDTNVIITNDSLNEGGQLTLRCNNALRQYNIDTINTSTGGTLRIYSEPLNTGAGTTDVPVTINQAHQVGIFNQSPTHTLDIGTDDAYKTTTSTWGISSDRRVKKDVVDANLSICYMNTKKLKLKYFAWDQTLVKTEDKHTVGFIAQDVGAVFKNAVIRISVL